MLKRRRDFEIAYIYVTHDWPEMPIYKKKSHDVSSRRVGSHCIEEMKRTEHKVLLSPHVYSVLCIQKP